MTEAVIVGDATRLESGERWTCGQCRVSYLKARPWHFSEVDRYRCEVPGCHVRYACSGARRQGSDVIVPWLL